MDCGLLAQWNKKSEKIKKFMAFFFLGGVVRELSQVMKTFQKLVNLNLKH